MEKYNVQLSKPARKFLAKQPQKLKDDVLNDIYKLPHSGNIDTIKGASGRLYRLRTHGVRVVYTVDHGELLVMVIDIDNRGDVYK